MTLKTGRNSWLFRLLLVFLMLPIPSVALPWRLGNILQRSHCLQQGPPWATRWHSRLDAAASSEAQRTVAPGSFEAEMEVKKSRFIGYAQHAETWQDAQKFLHQIRKEHPKGRHWCYAFRSGANPVSERCSDDGEPTGTAGLPILGAIKGEDLSDTVCVVVRYFGGIKLGAAGLIRAYGAAARLVLREAPIQILIPKTTFRLVSEATYVGSIYDAIARVSGASSEESYHADGSLHMTVTCETAVVDQLKESLMDGTRGNAAFSELDEGD